MTTIKKMQTALNYINKCSRSALQCVEVNGNSLYTNDLETMVTVFSSFGLHDGLYPLKTLDKELLNDQDEMMRTTTGLFSERVTVPVSNLKNAVACTSKDVTRLHLNGLHLKGSDMVATDGYVLRVQELNDTLNESYTLPSTSLNVLLKLCKLYDVATVTIELNENFASVLTDYFRVEMRLIQRDYVRYENVIPRKFEHTLKIDNISVTELRKRKKFTDKITRTAVIKISDGDVWLVTGDRIILIGETDVLQKYELGININYLINALEGKRSFEIKYNNDMSPMLVNETIIMPVRL